MNKQRTNRRRQRQVQVAVSAKRRVIFWRLLTSSEMSSLLARFWLTAAREACSISRIHLLMLSIDESHSRWPGALSLRMKWGQEKKRQRAIKNGWKWEQSGRMMYRREKGQRRSLRQDKMRHISRQEEQKRSAEHKEHLLKHKTDSRMSLSCSFLPALSSHCRSGHICWNGACRVSSVHGEIKLGS